MDGRGRPLWKSHERPSSRPAPSWKTVSNGISKLRSYKRQNTTYMCIKYCSPHRYHFTAFLVYGGTGASEKSHRPPTWPPCPFSSLTSDSVPPCFILFFSEQGSWRQRLGSRIPNKIVESTREGDLHLWGVISAVFSSEMSAKSHTMVARVVGDREGRSGCDILHAFLLLFIASFHPFSLLLCLTFFF